MKIQSIQNNFSEDVVMGAQIFLFFCLPSEYGPLVGAKALLLVRPGTSYMLLFLLKSK